MVTAVGTTHAIRRAGVPISHQHCAGNEGGCMTLTIEELKYGAEVGDLGIDAVRAVCAEALANREAQPVFFIEIEGDDWIISASV